MTVEAILAQDPHSKPATDRSPAPFVHASDDSTEQEFRIAYRAFVDAFRDGTLRLREPAREIRDLIPLWAFPPQLLARFLLTCRGFRKPLYRLPRKRWHSGRAFQENAGTACAGRAFQENAGTACAPAARSSPSSSANKTAWAPRRAVGR